MSSWFIQLRSSLNSPMFPSSEVPPSFDIRLTDRLPLDVSSSTSNSETTISPSHSPLHLQESDHSPTPLSTPVPFNPLVNGIGQLHLAAHSHRLDRDSRGFVSTYKMGPQGKRAIWVVRKRSRSAREVQIWTKDPYPNHDRNVDRVVRDVLCTLRILMI